MRVSFYRFILLSALCLLIFSSMARAEKVHTPAAGSAERKAIFNGLRPNVERHLKKKVIFKVEHLRAQNGWAFFVGTALRSNGKPLGQEDLWGSTTALLHKSKGRWRVAHWGLATDTGVMEECKKKFPNAPRAIFPQ